MADDEDVECRLRVFEAERVLSISLEVERMLVKLLHYESVLRLIVPEVQEAWNVSNRNQPEDKLLQPVCARAHLPPQIS